MTIMVVVAAMVAVARAVVARAVEAKEVVAKAVEAKAVDRPHAQSTMTIPISTINASNAAKVSWRVNVIGLVIVLPSLFVSSAVESRAQSLECLHTFMHTIPTIIIIAITMFSMVRGV